MTRSSEGRVQIAAAAAICLVASVVGPISDAVAAAPEPPTIDMVSSNYREYAPGPGSARDSFKVDLSVAADNIDFCSSGGDCRLTVDWGCIYPDGAVARSFYNGREILFSGTSVGYRYVADWSMTGCYSNAVSHMVFVVIASYDNNTILQARTLLEYGDFRLDEYATALSAVATRLPPSAYTSVCGPLTGRTGVFGACMGLMTGASEFPSAERLAGAILGAGGTVADLRAILNVTYDPVPPAPAGHTIVEGYDVDEIAAQIETNGSWAALILMANRIPSTNSNGGSTTDIAEEVMVAEEAGLPLREALSRLAKMFGVGILRYFVAADIPKGSDQPAGPVPDNGKAPNGQPGAGTSGNGNPGGPSVVTLEPDNVTVDEVVRAWYRRIADGRLGTSTVAADPEFVTIDQLRTVARQCLIEASAAIWAGASLDDANPCRDMRVFVPAGTGDGRVPVLLDAHEAAQHDLDAIASNPQWFQLNYMSSAAKEAQMSRQWYTREPYYSASGCKARRGVTECDEYPLYTTTQGGPIDRGGSGASLKPVSPAQNKAEGRVYTAMVTTSLCEMVSAPPVPKGTPAMGGTSFLVVPMPDLAIPSFFLC